MNEEEKIDLLRTKKRTYLLFILSFVITALMLFVPAGTLKYWQGWLFICVLFLPSVFITFYFLKYDPKLLERRLRFKEKQPQQKIILKIANFFFFAGFLIPGFDHRLGWSNVPAWLVILSDIIIFLGYVLVFFAFKENSYASRIIEVEKGQKVISTGPYSVVRHPMYAGAIPLLLCTPLALGSYYGLILFVPVVIVIVLRIFNEEKVLSKDLQGYTEYMQKVRFRLIPYIW